MAEKNKMSRDQVQYAERRLHELRCNAKLSIDKKYKYPPKPKYIERDINKKKAISQLMEGDHVRLDRDILSKSGLKKYNDYSEACKTMDKEHAGKLGELNQVFIKAWDQLYFGDALEIFSNIEKSIAEILK